MLEQEKPRRTIAERIRKKESKPKKAKTPKKRESYGVEVEPGEARIMWCPPRHGWRDGSGNTQGRGGCPGFS